MERDTTEPGHGGVQAGVARWVARTPDAPAVSCDGVELSYRELAERGRAVAAELRGVPRGAVVAVAMDRGVEHAVTLFGTVLAGCAYLPLDVRAPASRLRRMVLAAGTAQVLTSATATPAELRDGWSCPMSTVDAASPAAGNELTGDGQVAATDPLYVVFTSGSTGEPKPILMPHGPQVELFGWAERQYLPRATMLQYFPVTTDVASYELFSGWWSGAHMVLATEHERHDVARLAALVERAQVSRAVLPVSALQALAEHTADDRSSVHSLRELVTTGERLRLSPEIRALADALAPLTIDDQYGASEINVVTVSRWSTPTEGWPETPPLGPTLDGSSLHVLDARLRPTPRNVPGEIYVSGRSPAFGYLGRGGATAEAFLPDPFDGGRGRRMYRTGDLGRRRASGEIELGGRADFQIKVHGYRVEPGEIEAVLLRRPEVTDCVVTLADVGGSDDVLVAYVVPAGSAFVGDLRDAAATHLPAHMVPQAVVVLDALPRTASGKIDRARLPAPVDCDEPFVAPRDELEAEIVDVWRRVLGIEQISVHENFFVLGGHSMLVTRVMVELEEVTGVSMELNVLFEKPSVGQLAQAVRDERDREAARLEASR